MLYGKKPGRKELMIISIIHAARTHKVVREENAAIEVSITAARIATRGGH